MSLWRRAPALILGLIFLLTTAAFLHPHWCYLCGFLPLGFFLLREKEWKHMLAISATALLFYGHLHFHTSLPLKLDKKVHGKGLFEIETLRIIPSPFNRSYQYQGVLRTFTSEEGKVYKNLPCTLFLPEEKAREKADCDYEIEGVLSQKRAQIFALKPDKGKTWKPIKASLRFAEWRYLAKERVRQFLRSEIPQPDVYTFFVALVVGDVDERILAMEFAKLGLQHILGISGFHFVLLAGFFGALLRLIFPFKIAACILLLLLTTYFFFVGPAPATLRGWIAISVYLFARLFHFPTSALNALGVGLCLEILYDPFVVTSIGFQLSFLCTWAILLLYPLVRKGVASLFPQKTLPEVCKYGLLKQHRYLATSLFREAISLNLAVHLASLPLILFLFHKFPLQSLFYNLFFPFCFSLSLLLLITAVLLTFLIPPLGKLIHMCNNAFTGLLLDIARDPYPALDIPLRVREFPFALLVAILALVFVGT
ncbi:MAG: ComEC/Rec2 family competence protein, partial [Chlamydiales bacterium]